jgi:hypothetical protein
MIKLRRIRWVRQAARRGDKKQKIWLENLKERGRLEGRRRLEDDIKVILKKVTSKGVNSGGGVL